MSLCLVHYRQTSLAHFSQLFLGHLVHSFLGHPIHITINRLPDRGKNLPAFYSNAFKAVDVIQDWLDKDLLVGPLRENELPADWSLRVNPLNTDIKPNGTARVILDLSCPYLDDPDVDGTRPIAVNDGIPMEGFPTRMTSVLEIVTKLNSWGTEHAYIAKQDWQGLLTYIFPSLLNILIPIHYFNKRK